MQRHDVDLIFVVIEKEGDRLAALCFVLYVDTSRLI